MRIIPIATATLAALLMVACGNGDEGNGDDDNNTTSTSVCDQKDTLQVALTDLTEIDILAAGTDALQQSAANARTEMDAMKEVAGAEVSDEVEALDEAISEAEDVVNSLDDATVNEKIDELQRVFTQVATSAVGLGDALAQECG